MTGIVCQPSNLICKRAQLNRWVFTCHGSWIGESGFQNAYSSLPGTKFWFNLSHYLGQKSANILYKGPDTKYFRLVGHIVSVATSQQLPLTHKSSMSARMSNGHSCVPIKLHLRNRWPRTVVCQPLIYTCGVLLFCDYLWDLMPESWTDCVFPTICFVILVDAKIYYIFLSNNSLPVKSSLLFFPPWVSFPQTFNSIYWLLSNKQNSRHWRNDLKAQSTF